MKCGREILEGQVFCQECRADMERYPVKPGTVVQLPKRREGAPVRRNIGRRRTATPEEQIAKLRKSLRIVIALWVIAVVLLCAALYPAALYFMEEDHFLPGQNYSVMENTAPDEN